MIQKLFSIRDQKIASYNTPFVAPTAEAVMRQLKRDVEEKRGDLGAYPEDFDLYEVGTFDDESCVLQSFDAPKHIISCLVFKNAIANNVTTIQN